MSDTTDAFLGGAALTALLIALTDSDYSSMRTSRSKWRHMSPRERATRARSYARNILKTIRETPASLSNQRSQAAKLLRQVQIAHGSDRGVVGYQAVQRVQDLIRDLRRERGFRPVYVGSIDIS